ncbi:hypothetical protein OIU76_006225 [Salix suchowensis]|nr:hypothetical protein OIU76_006225 [Salix suchowensis]
MNLNHISYPNSHLVPLLFQNSNDPTEDNHGSIKSHLLPTDLAELNREDKKEVKITLIAPLKESSKQEVVFELPMTPRVLKDPMQSNRLKAPERPIPAAYEDSWAASRSNGDGPEPWLRNHADFHRVFLGGDSSGANIAHNLAVAAGNPETGLDIGLLGIALLSVHLTRVILCLCSIQQYLSISVLVSCVSC